MHLGASLSGGDVAVKLQHQLSICSMHIELTAGAALNTTPHIAPPISMSQLQILSICSKHAEEREGLHAGVQSRHGDRGIWWVCICSVHAQMLIGIYLLSILSDARTGGIADYAQRMLGLSIIELT